MTDRPNQSPTTGDWRPISTAPRDGTEVEVRNDRGRVWVDAYIVIEPGVEEGWPLSVTEWRPLP